MTTTMTIEATMSGAGMILKNLLEKKDSQIIVVTCRRQCGNGVLFSDGSDPAIFIRPLHQRTRLIPDAYAETG